MMRLPLPVPASPGEGLYGLLAEFEDAATLRHACQEVRDAGYTRWDAHTPYPVHGLDRAMGLRRSPLPYLVLVCGLAFAAGGFGLQTWVHSVEYPLVISGKPHFTWPAYVPVTFELGVLGGALAAVFGMFALAGLFRLYHPLFHSERFVRASDDRFFISIEAADPRFHPEATALLLQRAGATAVERVAD